MKKYYWMRIQKCNKSKTAFEIWYSYFKYKAIFFSLFNASVSFHGYINKILVEKLDIFVIIYLNDNMIYIEDTG